MREQGEKDIPIFGHSKTLHQLNPSHGIAHLGTSLRTWLCASDRCQQEFGYCQAECAGSINPAYRTPEFVCKAHSQLQRQNKGLFQTQRTKLQLTEKQTKSEITPYLQPNDIFLFCSSHMSPTSHTILQDYNRKHKKQSILQARAATICTSWQNLILDNY